jgi:hypothetical protein
MIAGFFGLRDVGSLMLPDKYYKASVDHILPELVVGLELEIENFPERYNGMDGVRFVPDGSLRNNGIEVVTLPTKVQHVRWLIKHVFDKYGITQDNYSDRCSVHVHVNVQDMTFEQLKTLCLTYQTTERLLFRFIGENRENNIFCVPWYQAGIANHFFNKLDARTMDSIRSWSKYTALNLIPVHTQGTVEFRHMAGTCDVERIMLWVEFLSCLIRYSKSMDYAEAEKVITKINTVSNYAEYIQDVFGKHAVNFTVFEDYNILLTSGVIDSKIMLVKDASIVAKPPLGRRTLAVDPAAPPVRVGDFLQVPDAPPPPEDDEDNEDEDEEERDNEDADPPDFRALADAARARLNAAKQREARLAELTARTTQAQIEQWLNMPIATGTAPGTATPFPFPPTTTTA